MPKFKIENGSEFEIPEGFNSIEDFIKAYNDAAAQAKMVETYSKKVGSLDDFDARLATLVAQKQKEAVDAAIAEGATKREAKQAGAEVANQIYDRWAELTPQQQVEFMTNQIQTTVRGGLEEMIKGYWTEAQKQLQGATAGSQQQFDLLAKALDLKLKNPDLDVNQVWGRMRDLATATPDKLMELAVQGVQTPGLWDAKLKEERAKWDEERDKKDAAERLKVLNTDSVPQWMKPKEERPSLNKPGGEDEMKNHILRQALNGEGNFKGAPLDPRQI